MRLRTFLMGLFLGSSLLVGCEPKGTEGELGVLNFQDRLDDVDDNRVFGGGRYRVDRPVALGARVKVQVSADGHAQAVASAKSNDMDVALVAEVTETAFTVKGVGAGAASIEVVTQDDLTDRFTVNVRPVERADLLVAEPAFLGGTAWESQEEIVLITGGSVDIAGRMQDADGAQLTGYGLLEFAGDDDTLATVTPRPETNEATITAGSAPGRATIKLDEYDRLTVDLVDESAVTDVTIFFMAAGGHDPLDAESPPLELQAGEAYFVNFEAKTADGRGIAAGLSTSPVIESDLAGLSHTFAPTPTDGEDDEGEAEGGENADAAPQGDEGEDEDDALPIIPWNGAGHQIGLFTFAEPGEGTLTGHWMGRTHTYRIIVIPKEAR